MGMMKPEASLDDKAIVAAAAQALSDIATIRGEVSKVIFGQKSVVENTILAVLSG
ncbi:AAA family ATPase, partial [Rhizobium johnstonii]